MPNIDALAIRRQLGRLIWLPPEPFGSDGWSFKHRTGTSSIIVTCADQDDGHDWIHASIAHHDRMPTYADLKDLHQAVFGGGWAYQVFAPPSQHVNIHSYALHLWGRLDGTAVLPDFTRGSGSV